VAQEEVRRRVLEDGLSPLEYLMSVYRDTTATPSARMSAATACLPYVHRKMPTDITTTTNDSATLAESVREHIRAAGVIV